MLVKTEDIPTFGSQASTSSSKKSWIEEALPVSKMRKDFEGMVSKHQRRLTEEIYNAVDNAADDLNMETGDLHLYLAYRECYLKNKKKAKALEAIKDLFLKNKSSQWKDLSA